MNKINSRTLDTNLSELIAAAGEVAFEYSDNDREAYKLARLALIEIVKNSAHSINADRDFERLAPPSQRFH